jgi:hypothetical protein
LAGQDPKIPREWSHKASIVIVIIMGALDSGIATRQDQVVGMVRGAAAWMVGEEALGRQWEGDREALKRQ